jgi:SAM-dependent methyltransferase
MSGWLAARIAPGGRAVAVDLDLSLVEVEGPGLELRQADILAGPVEPGDFDLVTARAVLHHVADAEAAVRNLVASVRPGVAILLIEPDFLPVSIAEPPEVRAFWAGWLAWSRGQGSTTSSAAGCRRWCPGWGCKTSGPPQRQRYIRWLRLGPLLAADGHRVARRPGGLRRAG